VLLGFSTGGFGGGLGNDLDNINNRYDFDALMSWEVRNLGFGERAARRESSARIQQAKFQKLRAMDQVAREISEAYSQVQLRDQQMTITQSAISAAENSYKRNLERIRDGQGLPLEVLQSVHALDSARRAYLRAVIAHNESQFRLQWALGWPVTASSTATDMGDQRSGL
jgi:outer membrane protein TolC